MYKKEVPCRSLHWPSDLISGLKEGVPVSESTVIMLTLFPSISRSNEAPPPKRHCQVSRVRRQLCLRGAITRSSSQAQELELTHPPHHLATGSTTSVPATEPYTWAGKLSLLILIGNAAELLYSSEQLYLQIYS